MALAANGPADRAEQLLALTQRLAVLVDSQFHALSAGDPLAGPQESDEFVRLSNLYRTEMGRIREDQTLVSGAPLALRRRLQTATQELQGKLDSYGAALAAAKAITEGLVQAIAEEIQQSTVRAQAYGAQGTYANRSAGPLALDKRA
jgi:hypothetical protein